MSESNVSKLIMLAVGRERPKTTLFRNNTGTAWQGSRTERIAGTNKLVVYDPRPVKFGLVKGGSDYVGFTEVTITADMVGQKVAVWTALEIKDKAKTSDDQLNFISVCKNAGAYAGVAKSDVDALEIIPN